MIGWILHKKNQKHPVSDSYGVRRLMEAAPQQKVDMKIVASEDFEIIVTREDRKSVLLSGKVEPLPQFLIPRLGAETNYFSLAVIRHLERLGVHTVNSSQAIETVKDKLYSHQILAQSGLPVPRTMLAKFPIDADLIEKTFGFPVVLKSISGLKGTGVFLAESRSNFESIMEFISSSNPNANIIIQEFISTSKGRDLRVFVIGGRSIACMQRKAAEGEFRANYSKGGSVTAYPINEEISWIASESARILGLDIAGVDLLFDEGHFKVCEVNSSPGYEGIEECHDIDVAAEIYKYVRARLGDFT